MKDEALKVAMEALDNLLYWDNGKPEYDEAREAITALKEALAQPEQEPVREEKYIYGTPLLDAMTQDYRPPQRTWVGLTDEEQMQIWDGIIKYAPSEIRIKDFAHAIEAKLKEKNQ